MTMPTTTTTVNIPEHYKDKAAPLTREEQLRKDIEAALRPLYDQSLEALEAQRLAQNAAIDVDAYSRGLGRSTWVTDAKLQALKGFNANVASLNADYNTKLYNQLQDAIGSGGGGGGKKPNWWEDDDDGDDDIKRNVQLPANTPAVRGAPFAPATKSHARTDFMM